MHGRASRISSASRDRFGKSSFRENFFRHPFQINRPKCFRSQPDDKTRDRTQKNISNDKRNLFWIQITFNDTKHFTKLARVTFRFRVCEIFFFLFLHFDVYYIPPGIWRNLFCTPSVYPHHHKNVKRLYLYDARGVRTAQAKGETDPVGMAFSFRFRAPLHCPFLPLLPDILPAFVTQ